MGDATIFSTLHTIRSYCQVKIAKRDKEKIELMSYQGLFQLIFMLFGLKNEPGTLQSAMEVILSKAQWQFVVVYVDDIMIFSKSLDEHIKPV